MVSSDQLPEIRTDLFVDGEVRSADDALQVIDPADGVSVVGYAAAATAPAVIGAVHAASGGWTAALLVMLGSTLALGTAELVATRRPKHLRS